MKDHLTNEIERRFGEKSTDELLTIWKANDRAEWSDAAFVAIKNILTERGVAFPPQPPRRTPLVISCPKCSESDIRRPYGWASFGTAIIALFLVAVVNQMLQRRFNLSQFIGDTPVTCAWVAVAWTFLSALFGKNRCKACGHRWKGTGATEAAPRSPTQVAAIGADGVAIVNLADYEVFLNELSRQRNKRLDIVQEQLEVFCAKCASPYTQEGLDHLYQMGPKSTYRQRMGNAVVLTNTSREGDALRSGRCPACGCSELRIQVPPATSGPSQKRKTPSPFFACPHCAQSLIWSADMAGKDTTCYHCGKDFTMSQSA